MQHTENRRKHMENNNRTYREQRDNTQRTMIEHTENRIKHTDNNDRTHREQ